MVFAKGIANGFPLSGIVSRKELMDKQTPGTMGGTFAGNAVSCAAGVACAEVMQEEKILENVQARSELRNTSKSFVVTYQLPSFIDQRNFSVL
jgi:4-aminobutyrate aminotransferase